MSSPPSDAHLSRAISEIDLNAALRAVQAQGETGPRYSADTLLALRPKTSQDKHAEHVEVAEISPDTEGLMTPPYHAYPKPPPPTPATPINGAQANVGEAASTDVPSTNGSGPVVVADQPKKKKKKSSGKNRKANPTGFEGIHLIASGRIRLTCYKSSMRILLRRLMSMKKSAISTMSKCVENPM